jgi:hypothetical protein
VELVGKEVLGLSMGKKGVDIQYGETAGDNSGRQIKPLDESKVKSDTDYRTAYMNLRRYQPNLAREKITDNMVRKQMEKLGIK